MDVTRRAAFAAIASVAGIAAHPERIGQTLTPEPRANNLHVYIPPELLAEIEQYAREQHITVDEFVRRALEQYCKNPPRRTVWN